MYDKTKPRQGATGLQHASAAEAEASFRLARYGILPHDAAYPVTFTDVEGATFTARSDFRHEASGVLIEFKASRLNGLKTKANADKALARLAQAEASGFIHDGNRQAATLKAAWSDSIHKQAAVVAALSPAKVVLVLKDDPDEKEARRLARAGIFWRTLKTIPAYALFLKLASMGLDVGFRVPGHSFGVLRNSV